MTQPLTIGNVQLATNLVLAPLSGYTDLPFRLIVRECGGVGLACTALLSPRGLLHAANQTQVLAATTPEDSPLAMQFYGKDTDLLCEAARWGEDHGADLIDINMGCSVPKVTRNNGGSRLLCDPDGAVRMVEQIAGVLRRVRLTVKVRLGWDADHIVAPYVAKRFEEVGVAAVTVHGRTAAMKFGGACDLDGIAPVVDAVKAMPIIGNGDVRTPEDAKRMLDHTGCAGVMIGRAVLSHPWLLRDTWAYLTTGTVPPMPGVREKCDLMRKHFRLAAELLGERRAVLEFRKFTSCYAKHMGPSRRLRQTMPTIQSAEEFERVVDAFLAWREELATEG